MRIAVITSTRADWGLLSPVVHELQHHGHEIIIVACNMHFLSEVGSTYREIERDGFKIDFRIYPGDTPAVTAASTLSGVAEAIQASSPDLALLLGDRYEILAAAQALALARVPIVHIAGGAVSEGAFDDSFRHAITKLASLHLVETDDYRRRVLQLGEDPKCVVTTGAIGLHNLLASDIMPLKDLEKSLDFTLGNNCLLVTMHAATLSSISPQEQLHNLLVALDSVPQCRIIITYPNNDVDPRPLIAMIEDYARLNRDRVCAVPSLGMRRYVAALKYVCAVVGNSSSGIVEAPSAGIPTLDVGVRQLRRTCADSVTHCGENVAEIVAGLRHILSAEVQHLASETINPYYRPDTLCIMCDAIEKYPVYIHSPKHFFDL